MPKLLRWTRNVLVTLAVVAGLALVTVYALSERILRRRWEVTATTIQVPSDPAAIERGSHLAATRGCAGCHGAKLEGRVFFDEPRIARLVAPNLTELARRYSVDELDGAIRHGVRANGATVRGMPSETFRMLTDSDFGDLVAFLKSMPAVTSELPETEIRILGRIGLVTGQYKLAASQIATMPPPRPAPAPDDVEGQGRYLAHTMCVECHGLDLRGDAGGGPEPSPSLAIVASYTPEEFERLLHTGVPSGGPALKLMAGVAKARFVHLTGAEVDALYRYLRLLADPGAATRL